MITKEDEIFINDEKELQYLIHRFKNAPAFAEAIVFENDDNVFYETY